MFASFATAARRNHAVGAFDPLTVRRARAEDRPALARLAALDSQRAMRDAREVLLAEVDDRPVAALDVSSGRVAADPFVRTGQAVRVLRTLAR